MSFLEQIHAAYVTERRVRRLAHLLADFIPSQAQVLDVGAGDGRLAELVGCKRRDVSIRGFEVLLRPQTRIPVDWFDGKSLPSEDKSFDTVLLIDVLHHTRQPELLLGEGMRVARHNIIIKDHSCEGLFAVATLRFMDDVGNVRYGVALPHNYWTQKKWFSVWQELGLQVEEYLSILKLYPWPVDLIFGRSLHFVANLKVPL